MAVNEITTRSVKMFSEGTRLAAEIYKPGSEKPAAGYPAILLCHGWGGLKNQLVDCARVFAEAGFLAMTFDYRGWGESDGRVIALSEAPPLLEAGERTLTVRVLREVVDPVDQSADIRNCLALLSSEPEVDPARLGIWGTSYGAGLAVHTTGRDRRIRAAVAQIGAYGLPEPFRVQARARGADKARGAIDPVVPQGGVDAPPNLMGTPDLARMAELSPLAAAADIRVPTLIIDAEFEELVNRLEHGFTAHMIIRQNAISDYKTFPGQHYDLYHKFFQESTALAKAWFSGYL